MLENMSTVEFINALRRFVARHGLPTSITYDNAPTFILTSSILKSRTKEPQLNEEATNLPIRNRRTQEDLTSIRPVDFLQRDINITFPHERLVEPTDDDTDYLPPDELRTLQTRQKVNTALKSSCEATAKFWKIWQDQYLTSLREKHKTWLTNQEHGQQGPKIGDVVLVCDPILPRNEWRMARITGTHRGSDKSIREMELITSTHWKIRRPVNLITPLEISAHSSNPGSSEREGNEDGARRSNNREGNYGKI
ncbi:hypothetical protein RB195_011360 [Necator americanus]|uniref:DUF5641 domain-containing protein n=1 Tax=Necator americanus TaxID=51031 RepID=A0ABR1D205_NECAM